MIDIEKNRTGISGDFPGALRTRLPVEGFFRMILPGRAGRKEKRDKGGGKKCLGIA
jgi:hypothetical protein